RYLASAASASPRFGMSDEPEHRQRLDDAQARESSVELAPLRPGQLHEAEQIAIAAHDQASIGRKRKVHVVRVVRIVREEVTFGHRINKGTTPSSGAPPSSHAFRPRTAPPPRPRSSRRL